MALDARSLRRGLRCLAHSLNENGDWQRLTSRQHLEAALKAADRALVGARGGGDDLATAAAHLLCALEKRERERSGEGQVIAHYGA